MADLLMVAAGGFAAYTGFAISGRQLGWAALFATVALACWAVRWWGL